MGTENLKGFLVLKVEEASGKSERGTFCWDTASGPLEAFIKVEIRGGVRNVKAQTRKSPLIGDVITWGEELRLELLEGSSELRFLLCREKFIGNKKGTSVIAACGIYVNDILDAVPIDKFFELFKPNAGGEGGYVRISMKTVQSLTELDAPQAPQQPFVPRAAFGPGESTQDVKDRLQDAQVSDVKAVADRVVAIGNDTSEQQVQEAKAPAKRRRRFPFVPLLLTTAAVVSAVVLKRR